jgi:hypothetical protein
MAARDMTTSVKPKAAQATVVGEDPRVGRLGPKAKEA